MKQKPRQLAHLARRSLRTVTAELSMSSRPGSPARGQIKLQVRYFGGVDRKGFMD